MLPRDIYLRRPGHEQTDPTEIRWEGAYADWPCVTDYIQIHNMELQPTDKRLIEEVRTDYKNGVYMFMRVNREFGNVMVMATGRQLMRMANDQRAHLWQNADPEWAAQNLPNQECERHFERVVENKEGRLMAFQLLYIDDLAKLHNGKDTEVNERRMEALDRLAMTTWEMLACRMFGLPRHSDIDICTFGWQSPCLDCGALTSSLPYLDYAEEIMEFLARINIPYWTMMRASRNEIHLFDVGVDKEERQYLRIQRPLHWSHQSRA